MLFDCHSAIDSPGMKVGNKLVLDLQGAGAVPNETKKADGAMQCEIRAYDGLDPKGCWLSWVGRSAGGEHPLGFQIDNLFTIIELDNYGGNGKPAPRRRLPSTTGAMTTSPGSPSSPNGTAISLSSKPTNT